MINWTSETKEKYKDYNREIKARGILYLGEKRISNNLLNQSIYTSLANMTYSNGVFTQIQADSNNNPYMQLQTLIDNTYIATIGEKNLNNEGNKIYFQFTKTSSFNRLRYKVNGSQIDTGVIFDVSNLENNKQYYIGATFTNKTQGSISWRNMYINENNEEYEEYGTYVIDYTEFSLSNDCKILSFTINEKADVYYTSLPYNTMTIEVNNENGYFTDYDPNSIIEKLNEDCYVNLYLQIGGSGAYFKIMTMNFDKISYSDYEKAKLDFYTNLGRIKEYDLKDKNGAFVDGLDFWREVKQYVLDNYNINLTSDHPYITDNVDRIIISFDDYENLNELLLSTATSRLGQVYGAEVLLTSDYNNNIMLKAISNQEEETIITNLQLERPIIKREDTYKGVYYNWRRQNNYVATSETYTYSFTGTLNSTRDTLVIVDDYYRLSDITISDITASSNVNVSIVQIASYYKNMLSLVIEGNIGDGYDIAISKANIYKNEPTDLVKWPLGQTNDTSKILEIEDKASIESSPFVFLFIKKPMKSYVEAKIMGLPYLEIGDTINIVQDNRNVKIFITEINTTYNDGLLQTIKGYELDWGHQVTGIYEGIYGDLNDWEGLLPSDDLYPRNDLYPY